MDWKNDFKLLGWNFHKIKAYGDVRKLKIIGTAIHKHTMTLSDRQTHQHPRIIGTAVHKHTITLSDRQTHQHPHIIGTAVHKHTMTLSGQISTPRSLNRISIYGFSILGKGLLDGALFEENAKKIKYKKSGRPMTLAAVKLVHPVLWTVSVYLSSLY